MISFFICFTDSTCAFYSYKQTIGLDFFIKQMVLPGDIHVAMQVNSPCFDGCAYKVLLCLVLLCRYLFEALRVVINCLRGPCQMRVTAASVASTTLKGKVVGSCSSGTSEAKPLAGK